MASVVPRSKHPHLLSKLDGHTDTVNAALVVPREDAVISVSDDKTMRVWVKRDNGQYWPTICQSYPASASAVAYHHESQRLFVGLGNGTINEYKLSQDLNRLDQKRTYLAHSGRVTALKFVAEEDWILSVSRDKYFQWHCTKTGRKLGSFEAQGWCLAVEYDPTHKYAFVSDYGGTITVLKLDVTEFRFITTLKGHQSSVRCLTYDKERRILFSGGFDQIIILWDIGSQKGTAYELTGHKGKVRSLLYSLHTRKLISSADDAMVGVWDVETQREETAEWGAGNTCEKCGVPFFWNVKEMWEKKTIGVRQHHCRKCGRAVCGKCSDRESTYPPMGYEIPVRMCADCHTEITTDDRTPLADFWQTTDSVVGTSMDLDQPRGVWAVVGTDKNIRIYDIKPLLT